MLSPIKPVNDFSPTNMPLYLGIFPTNRYIAKQDIKDYILDSLK